MTRGDLAVLVIRTIALWLGASGLASMVIVPWLPGAVLVTFDPTTVGLSLVPLAAGAVLWSLARPVARRMFARPADDVELAVAAPQVPPLASFVAGLLLCTEAIPSAAGWLALMVLRYQRGGLIASGMSDLLDQQTTSTGASLVARIALGVTLIAISRRPALWAPAANAAAPDEPPDTASR